MRRFMNVKEAAEYLRVTEDDMAVFIGEGELPFLRSLNGPIFDRQTLQRFFHRNSVVQANPTESGDESEELPDGNCHCC